MNTMNQTRFSAAAAASLLWLLTAATHTAHAADVDVAKAVELAKASGCYSCHADADKVVGPGFKVIAAKYAGEAGAAAGLAQSIQNGSRGKWGRIPMPGHSLAPDELQLLSHWIMGMKD